MAVFKLQLVGGDEKILHAGRAVRTESGRILLEDTDDFGRWQLLQTYEPSDVSAVLRRGPAEGGIYTWDPQPPTGRWWVY